jgi:Bacterial RNA polymerase, alpha chain C terminal domain
MTEPAKSVPEAGTNFHGPETSIAELPISRRVYHCLIREGCQTLGDVLARSPIEWYRVPNMGKKAQLELAEVLAFYDPEARRQWSRWFGKPVKVPTVAQLRQRIHGPSNERNEAVWQDRQAGMYLGAIGKRHGIGVERVRQIVKVEQQRAERLAAFDAVQHGQLNKGL